MEEDVLNTMPESYPDKAEAMDILYAQREIASKFSDAAACFSSQEFRNAMREKEEIVVRKECERRLRGMS